MTKIIGYSLLINPKNLPKNAQAKKSSSIQNNNAGNETKNASLTSSDLMNFSNFILS